MNGKDTLTIILGKIFIDFFQFLAQFRFTTSEAELDYYHQKEYELHNEFANRLRLKILGNKEISRKSLKCLDLMGVCSRPPKAKF